LLLALFVRIGWVAFVDGPTLRFQAQSQYRRIKTVDPVRGRILSKNGNVLAKSELVEDVALDPRTLHGTDEVKLLGLAVGVPEQRIERMISRSAGSPVVLRRDISPSFALRIARLGLAGVSLRRHWRRVYQQGNATRSVVGSVDSAMEGFYGIESSLNDLLKGRPASSSGIYAGNGRLIAGSAPTTPDHGSDVRLTLDDVLQSKIEVVLEDYLTRLHARRAEAVVLDAGTGDVWALASVPTVYFVHASTREASLSPAVAHAVRPGLLVLPLLASYAISNGVLDKQHLLNLRPLSIDGRVLVPDPSLSPHPSVRQTITEPSPVSGALLAEALGARRARRALSVFGWDRRTGIELKEETSGRRFRHWATPAFPLLGTGQLLSVSPLQIASAYGVFAADGDLVRPHLREGGRPHGVKIIDESAAETAFERLRLSPLATNAVAAAAVGGGTLRAPPRASSLQDIVAVGFPNAKPQLVTVIVVERARTPLSPAAAIEPLLQRIVQEVARSLP
jgi:cell division protein FtsI (penicillin-binding protein 3)